MLDRWLPIVALLSILPSAARAHPLVDEGRRLYDEAEFEDAMRALERAENTDNLLRTDLIELLRIRVLLRIAMEDRSALEADVERLLSLDPRFDFGSGAPPEVGEAVSAMRRRIQEPIGITTRVEATASGAAVHAEVANDPAGLAREIRIRARAGDGPWVGPLASPLEVALSTDQALTYHAEVIGPGGAVLATAGTADAPLSWSAAASGDDSGLWIGLGVGIGVAVLAAAIILTTVFVLDSQNGVSDQTRPSLPVIATF